MNLQKAIVSGIIFYAVMFLVASATLPLAATTDIGFGIMLIIVSGILTFVVGKHFYFKTEKKGLGEGFSFAVILIIVAVLIEIPVMVYGFAAEQGWNYFTSWHLLLGYIVTLGVGTWVGKE